MASVRREGPRAMLLALNTGLGHYVSGRVADYYPIRSQYFYIYPSSFFFSLQLLIMARICQEDVRAVTSQAP